MTYTETFGPCGIGKSTNFSLLKSELKAISIQEHFARYSHSIFPSKHARTLGNRKLSASQKSEEFRRFLYLWLESHGEFQELCGAIFSQKGGYYKKYKAYDQLRNRMELMFLLKFKKIDVSLNLLSDGGVIQSLYEFLPWNEEGLLILPKFLESIPLPDKIVFYQVDGPEILVCRILKRKKTWGKMAACHFGRESELQDIVEKSIWFADKMHLLLRERMEVTKVHAI